MNKQDIEIYDVDVMVNCTTAVDDVKSMLSVRWNANIGFGEYNILFMNDLVKNIINLKIYMIIFQNQ